MSLALQPYRIVESAERRVLGAFRFVDSVTRLPVIVRAKVEARAATLVGTPADGDVVLPENGVRIRQNSRGFHVIFLAPFFDIYTRTFDNPQRPPETPAGSLRLRLAAAEVGSYYLPQEFEFDLPRSLDPAASHSVFVPQTVGLFRAPNASVQDGWTVLRVRVTEAGTNPQNPLPGVLVRVFRSPRAAGDPVIGEGMSDWRRNVRGEVLVPLTSIQRFRPGSGSNVVETEQAIEFEATRDSGFTGAAGQLPNVPRILSGAGPSIIRPPDQPPGSQLQVLAPVLPPDTPVRVRSGREYVVHLALP